MHLERPRLTRSHAWPRITSWRNTPLHQAGENLLSWKNKTTPPLRSVAKYSEATGTPGFDSNSRLGNQLTSEERRWLSKWSRVFSPSWIQALPAWTPFYTAG